MNVDELERRFVRAAQRELTPSAADRERNQAALFERLAAPSWSATPGAALEGPLPSPPGSGHVVRSMGAGALAGIVGALRGSRFGMLGVGLVVGAMVGGWFGFGLGRDAEKGEAAAVSAAAVSRAGAAAAAGAPGDMPSASARGDAEPGATTESLSGSPASAPVPLDIQPSPAPADDEVSRRGAVASRAPAPRRLAEVAPPQSSLAQELAMLQRARRALNAENARLALGIVQELDERFPKGVLVEERSATRILSLCQLERLSEATQAAREFLERYPSSVYAERVRQSCGAAAVPR